MKFFNLFCPGTKGQRDRQNFFVLGQRDTGTEVPSLSRDKLKILPRDGTVRDFLRLSRPGTSRGTKSPSILHIYAVFKFKKKKKKIKKNQKKNFLAIFLAILSRALCSNTRVKHKDNSVHLKPKTEFRFNWKQYRNIYFF